MKNATKKTDDFFRRLEEFRRRYELYQRGDRLLVALSGGKDSVCLLRVILEQRKRLGLTVYAAHVHHGLRASADRDLAFCQTLCDKLGVEFFVCRVDAAEAAKARGIGVEEAGRELRYEYFSRLQQQLGVHRVLTAHTASDQCETLLMRLLRGGALRGLCAIPVKRGSICRPLLCVSSEEVLSYLRSVGQDWVEDESNGKDAYCRNRVRRQIVPLLKKENPSLEQTLLHNTLALRRDYELLDALCGKTLKGISSRDGLTVDCKALRELCGEPGMEGLFAHAVARAVKSLGVGMPSAERCEAMTRLALHGQAGKQISFGGGRMRLEQSQIVFFREEEEAVEEYCIPLEDAETLLPQADAKIRRFPSEKSENYKNINKMLMIMKINSATISGGLVARSRRAQDRIVINGMKKSVKKLLCDAKLPAAFRRRIPVIEDEQGIVWVPGVGLCDRARPREGQAFFTLELQGNGISREIPGQIALSENSVPPGRDEGE